MDFANEPYVRLYTRNSTTWRRLPWQARAIFPSILRVVDRAGILPLEGMTPAAAVALHIEMPLEFVEAGLPALMAPMDQANPSTAVIHLTSHGLLVRRFIDANEAIKSDKQRQRDSRARRRDLAAADSIPPKPDHKPSEVSRAVTNGHVVTPPVTLNQGSTEPLLPTREPAREEPEQGREAAKGQTQPEPRCQVVEIRPPVQTTLIADTSPEAKRGSRLLFELTGKLYDSCSKHHAQSLHVLGGRPDSEWAKARPVILAEMRRKARVHTPDIVAMFWVDFYALGESPPEQKPKGQPVRAQTGEFVSTPNHLPELGKAVPA